MTKEDRKRLEELVKTIPLRPKRVLEYLLKKGEVSTYQLGKLGYDQPPRAAMDLKDIGVKLVTKSSKHPKTGNRMVIYMLDDDQSNTFAPGRKAFPKNFKQEIIDRDDSKCILCDKLYSSRFLQIDHKIPFILGGEDEELNSDDFQ